MKIIKNSMAILFSLIIMLQFIIIPSWASASASVSINKSSLSIGETLTVKVTYTNSPNPIGAVEGYLSFNSSVLEFVSGDGNTNLFSGSKVKMINTGDGSGKSLSFSMSFKCKAAGSSSLSVSGTVLDLETEQGASVSTSKSVTVKSSEALSTVATLKSLSGSYGNLTPKFSSNVTSYSVTIPNNITTYTINAVPTHEKAKTEYFGSKDMKVGKNTRSVVVTAEDGVTKKTYTITITRTENSNASSKPTSSSDISSEEISSEISNEFIIGENKYTVLTEWQVGTKIPVGFEAIEYSLNGKYIAALKSIGGTILVYAADESQNECFVIYDENSNIYSDFHAIEYEEKSYILTERDRTAPVPTDFFPSKKEIGGVMTDVWMNEKGETLIYATDTDGKFGFFKYDQESGKIEFFSFEPEPESVTSSEPEQKSWFENLKDDNETLFKIVVIETGIIIILLIILIVLLCLYLNKSKRGDDNYYDENDDSPYYDDYIDNGFGGDEFTNQVISEEFGSEICDEQFSGEATDEEFNGEISDDFRQLFDVIE